MTARCRASIECLRRISPPIRETGTPSFAAAASRRAMSSSDWSRGRTISTDSISGCTVGGCRASGAKRAFVSLVVHSDEGDLGRKYRQMPGLFIDHFHAVGNAGVALALTRTRDPQDGAVPHAVAELDGGHARGDELALRVIQAGGDPRRFVHPCQQAAAKEVSVVIEIAGQDEAVGFHTGLPAAAFAVFVKSRVHREKTGSGEDDGKQRDQIKQPELLGSPLAEPWIAAVKTEHRDHHVERQDEGGGTGGEPKHDKQSGSDLRRDGRHQGDLRRHVTERENVRHVERRLLLREALDLRDAVTDEHHQPDGHAEHGDTDRSRHIACPAIEEKSFHQSVGGDFLTEMVIRFKRSSPGGEWDSISGSFTRML